MIFLRYELNAIAMELDFEVFSSFVYHMEGMLDRKVIG